jgi:hypothetical protein
LAKKFPGYFHGLVGAWCPSVQYPKQGVENTGDVTLYDLSGNGFHGVSHYEAGADLEWEFTGSKSPATPNDMQGWTLHWPSTCDVSVDLIGTDKAAKSDAGTLAAWALKDSDFGNSRYILSRNRSGTSSGACALYHTTTLDEWRFFIEHTSGSYSSSSDSPAPHGKMTHLVATWSNVDGTRLYVDGVLQTQQGSAWSTNAAQDWNFSIGWNSGYSDTHGEAWEGCIDDCAIWERALSLEEVRGLYHLGRGGWHANRNQFYIPGPIGEGFGPLGVDITASATVTASQYIPARVTQQTVHPVLQGGNATVTQQTVHPVLQGGNAIVTQQTIHPVLKGGAAEVGTVFVEVLQLVQEAGALAVDITASATAGVDLTTGSVQALVADITGAATASGTLTKTARPPVDITAAATVGADLMISLPFGPLAVDVTGEATVDCNLQPPRFLIYLG